MTPLDKAREALAAVAKATAGEWERRGPAAIYGNLQRDQNSTADLVARTVTDNDAAAIVPAVNFVRADLPAFLAEHERLADRVAKLEGAASELLTASLLLAYLDPSDSGRIMRLVNAQKAMQPLLTPAEGDEQ